MENLLLSLLFINRQRFWISEYCTCFVLFFSNFPLLLTLFIYLLLSLFWGLFTQPCLLSEHFTLFSVNLQTQNKNIAYLFLRWIQFTLMFFVTLSVAETVQPNVLSNFVYIHSYKINAFLFLMKKHVDMQPLYFYNTIVFFCKPTFFSYELFDYFSVNTYYYHSTFSHVPIAYRLK